jgi:site-specific DNA recombinase
LRLENLSKWTKGLISKRTVGYFRVSDPSQVEGHSLDAQERLFYEACKNKGWEPVKVYREEGKSANVEAINRRPLFNQLLDDAAKSQFNLVAVHTLDRWSRNLKVTLESLSILGRYKVGLVSLTENIDYSTPEGMLFLQMIGAFAQYFSGSLGKHVSKGLDQRAFEGKHTCGIPFGYDSCWLDGEKGERILRCEREHAGGIHIHIEEGPAVIELFKRYATGTTTLSRLATWLNERGFRTRNMHPLPDASGSLKAGPKLFTTASVRGILHNPFYAGKIIHRGKSYSGVHEPFVSQEMFDTVQTTLKKNSGRSETLSVKPERQYLLKGIIRCAYCGMPMWAQTYDSGISYYREHKGSRSHAVCPGGAAVTCHTFDDQVKKLISAIELGSQWLEEVLAIISLKDEVTRVKKSKKELQEKLRRMARAYIDGLFPDEEYHRQKKLMELELESLVVPGADAAEEAGKLIINLRDLWAEANLEKQRTLLLTMLDAVYVDAKKAKSIIAIRPKPPFRPIFQVAVTKQDSGIRIINEPLGPESGGSVVFLVETGEGRTPRPKEAARNLLQA